MIKDSISLIANTGLQFYTFETYLDASIQKNNKFRFIERFDSIRKRFWLDEVISLPGDDIWVRKSQLETLGYISKSGKIASDIDLNHLELLSDTDFYEAGNINQVVKYFEKKWIPVPFFKKNNIDNDYFGPTDWARIYFEKIGEEKIKVVLLIDTTSTNDTNNTVSPFVNENPNENIYAICSNDNITLSYLDSITNCQWVEDYISKLFYSGKTEIETPFLKHIANYIFFIRMLRTFENLPQIHLLSDKTGLIDVDLVIDVGNSNTCALLFENSIDQNFNFNSVKKLEIQDFENPFLSYAKSFSTRIVFKEANFGSFNTELNLNNKFQWPSPVRIGYEAERTIKDANVELKLNREVKTYNSSPKRYLWDLKPSSSEWEYHLNDVNTPPVRVYKKGVSEQLNSDGSLCLDSFFGSSSLFSRQSLMTFVYIEIFCQALRQINSIEFRSLHGNPSKKRKLKRIVISCPTAMIKNEQVALRECANHAMTIINQYNFIVSGLEPTNNIYENEVEIVPSVKDLKLNLENLEKRKDWIYDEATSAQMVYLYGMIKYKFDGNPNLFFNLFGKHPEKTNSSTKKSITIGSLDIGGGTSDLMICKYDYKYDEITELYPEPLFWESFNLAGDDLLKDIIQQIIIEGQNNNEADIGCQGVIENYARKKGISEVTKKLTGFFGKDSNNIGYKGKLMRVNFINQIAIPIALRYMKNANLKQEMDLTYNDLFKDKTPNPELLNYFEKHFGFRFEEITWKLSSSKVNEIITSVFSKLIKQISNLMNKYSCDIVLLSGRPCSFEALENLFLKYHPIPPNRLINMNKYWIGRWYPFSDNNGFVEDPKTVVTVGSLISLMAGTLFKLDKFRINNSYLKTKLISTADYFGQIKEGIINEVLISPEKNESTFTVHSIPFQIGFKNLNSKNYPARNIYALEFNDERIAELANKNGNIDDFKLADSIETIKHKLRTKMPFKVNLTRDIEKDKEELKIQEVLDYEQNEISKSYFNLVIQTLPEQSGYWLDSGEFTLNIRN